MAAKRRRHRQCLKAGCAAIGSMALAAIGDIMAVILAYRRMVMAK